MHRYTYELDISITEGPTEMLPSVSRTLRVPGTLTLGQLSRALVAAFGWEGDHSHVFHAGSNEPYAGGTTYYSAPDFAPEDPAVGDENSAGVAEVVRGLGRRFFWEYDTGNSWIHQIRAREVAAAPGQTVVCLAAVGSAPPDDGDGDVPETTRWARRQPEPADLDAVSRAVADALAAETTAEAAPRRG